MKRVILADLETQQPDASISRKVASAERLEFIEYRYRGGAQFPLHRHPSEQFTIVIQGALVFTNEQAEACRLDVGEGVFIAGNEPHGAHVPEDIEETVTYNVFTPRRSEVPNMSAKD